MDEGEFNGRRLYNGLRLDYRLIRLFALTSALPAISAVAELLVSCWRLASGDQYIFIVISTASAYDSV